MLVQIITGHNYMRKHQNTIDTANKEEGEDPTCDLCHDGEQSSQHIIGECGALIPLRRKHFGTPFIFPPYTKLKKKALENFLREVPIGAVKFFLQTY